MEWIRKCPMLFALAVSGVIFSLVGIIGRGSVYKEYDFNIITRPFLALAMEGMSKDVSPWEVFGIGTGTSAQVLASGDGQSIDGLSGGQSIDGTAGLTSEEMEAMAQAGSEGATENAQQTEGAQSAEEGVMASEGGVDADTQDNGVDGTAGEYEFVTVPESYFNDAVFIGDSRTVGMYEYGGIEDRADFFGKISLTIYDVFTEKVAKDEVTGKKITVEEALSRKKYGKVYLMLGINELGTGTTESFMEEYKEVVERLVQLQPDAVIYVQGIMRVTGEKNETDPIFNNTNINEKNAEIAKLADNERIFYIDVNEVVCDEEGNLNEEYTTDEIHLKAKYYELWKEFLLRHGVVR